MSLARWATGFLMRVATLGVRSIVVPLSDEWVFGSEYLFGGVMKRTQCTQSYISRGAKVAEKSFVSGDPINNHRIIIHTHFGGVVRSNRSAFSGWPYFNIPILLLYSTGGLWFLLLHAIPFVFECVCEMIQFGLFRMGL